jgi:CheY-like chemotaxis protein
MAKKILIIDDNDVGLALLRGQLNKSGYAVYQALNGKDGLEKIKFNKPDLIILDVMMPVMDGFAFTLELKKTESCRDIPIIILSAHEEVQGLFADKGIRDFLKKPVGFEDLKAKVTALLGE